jgi:epoxyqueuosine reductase
MYIVIPEMDLNFLKQTFEDNGFDHYGWTTLEKPMTMAYYKSWVEQNFHADMDYLKRHIELKETPQLLLKKAKTAFVFGRNYFENQDQNFPLKQLKIASYAKQEDYHVWFQKELDSLCEILKAKYPDQEFIAFTDSKPVLERDLAYRAGLGWVGKNTCLIDEKKGSLFFIGEIYSTLEITAKLDVHPDRCGTCTRCIDICPTNALIEPKVLDSNKCISYWTIESKKVPPLDLRDKFDGWYYGCDLCQTVCPWNQKIYKEELKNENLDPSLNRPQLIAELKEILNLDTQNLKELFKNSPMNRAKPWAHKRNAILVAVHYDLKELKQDLLIALVIAKGDKNLEELVNWAINKL